MDSYRRTFQSNGCYFFTLKQSNSQHDYFLQYVGLLEKSLSDALCRYPGIIQGMVVLPDHLHLMLTFPKGCQHHDLLIQTFRKNFAKYLATLGVVRSFTPYHPRSIWQLSYWQHQISSSENWQLHLDYLHSDPVRHGLVQHIIDWKYSSFHQYVEEGVLPRDWHIDEKMDGEFGE